MPYGPLGRVFAGLTSANLRNALDRGVPVDILAQTLSPELRGTLEGELKGRSARQTQNNLGINIDEKRVEPKNE